MEYVWVVQGGWFHRLEPSEFGLYKTFEGAKKGANAMWGSHQPPLEWVELAENVWAAYGIDDYFFDVSLRKIGE